MKQISLNFILLNLSFLNIGLKSFQLIRPMVFQRRISYFLDFLFGEMGAIFFTKLLSKVGCFGVGLRNNELNRLVDILAKQLLLVPHLFNVV